MLAMLTQVVWNETAPKRNVESGLRSMAIKLSAAQSLKLWHDVALSQVKDDEPDLSVPSPKNLMCQNP
jgi:hypothetical protein